MEELRDLISYTEAREIAEEYGERDEDGTPTNVYKLADALRDWQEEYMPELPASVWSDLLRALFYLSNEHCPRCGAWHREPEEYMAYQPRRYGR